LAGLRCISITAARCVALRLIKTLIVFLFYETRLNAFKRNSTQRAAVMEIHLKPAITQTKSCTALNVRHGRIAYLHWVGIFFSFMGISNEL